MQDIDEKKDVLMKGMEITHSEIDIYICGLKMVQRRSQQQG